MKGIQTVPYIHTASKTDLPAERRSRSYSIRLITAVLFLLLCLSACGKEAPPSENEAAADTVSFSDPALEEAVCNALGIDDRPITIKEAKKVKSLDLSYDTELTDDENARGDIRNLTGLSCFEKLEELDLSHNKISDVSELSDLKHLRILHLEGNEISDVEPLGSLKTLTLLDLEGNQVSNIYTLKDLTRLTVFDIRNNLVSDISVVSDMRNLEENERY